MSLSHRATLVARGAIFLALLQGCAPSRLQPPQAAPTSPANPADTLRTNPDPSVLIALEPSPMLIENPQAGGQGGVVKVFGVRGTSTQISLYFDARTQEPHHRDLSAYAAWADEQLNDRDIQPLDIRADRNPIRDAGFPSVARTYVNVQRPGGPAPTAICDAAGLRFETPGGFWTISWNADLGKINESLPVIHEFLRVMRIARTTN